MRTRPICKPSRLDPVIADRVPSVIEPPSLADLGSNLTLALVINTIFRGRVPGDRRSETLMVGFVRIVDKAVREYEACRTALHASRAGGRRSFGKLLEAVASMESCVNALARAHLYVGALRSYRRGPRISRHTAALSTGARNRIRNLRDAIEHMDERILAGKLAEEEPVALLLDGGCVALGTTRVSFGEMAGWLRGLHGLAFALASRPEYGEHDA